MRGPCSPAVARRGLERTAAGPLRHVPCLHARRRPARALFKGLQAAGAAWDVAGGGAAGSRRPGNAASGASSSGGGGGGGGSGAAAQAAEQQQQQQQQQPSGPRPDPKLLRRAAAARSAADALDALLSAAAQQQHHGGGVYPSAEDAELLIALALEKGNADLALAVYGEMCVARRDAQRARPPSAGAGVGGGGQWPAATLGTAVALILGLCRQLRVTEALAVMQGMRSQGMPRNEEVSFGFVVPSPLPPNRPLAVVQPQEGAKVVADADSRYEFELFSGSVTTCSSEAQQPAGNWALAAARAVGLWRAPPVAAVHTWVVRAPDGTSRTFRAATATADVPAQPGERVTVVSAPERGRSKQKRLLLTTAPPGTRAGEPMSVVNHRTGAALQLSRPPPPGQSAVLPGWVLPAAVLFAGSDAASALLDPALPALIAAGAATVVGSAVAGNSLVVPQLKKLPSSAVRVEGVRQALLAQHASLSKKVGATLQEASEDARALARLWQLQVKMESVGGGGAAAAGSASASGSGGRSPATSSTDGGALAPAALLRSASGGVGTYAARISRVEAARRGVEERLASRLELIDGYARVMDMIEIEVEMEIDVAAAELDGIGEQMARLAELEALQDEWRVQAEAQDEVERLLRAPGGPL